MDKLLDSTIFNLDDLHIILQAPGHMENEGFGRYLQCAGQPVGQPDRVNGSR